MKLKIRQYRELMDRLNIQINGMEAHCLNHRVSQELSYIQQAIQSSLNYLGSAHDQLEAMIKENEGKCDE